MSETRKTEEKQKREWLTIWATAKALKWTNYMVLMNIATGKFRIHEFNGRVYIARESVEAMLGQAS